MAEQKLAAAIARELRRNAGGRGGQRWQVCHRQQRAPRPRKRRRPPRRLSRRSRRRAWLNRRVTLRPRHYWLKEASQAAANAARAAEQIATTASKVGGGKGAAGAGAASGTQRVRRRRRRKVMKGAAGAPESGRKPKGWRKPVAKVAGGKQSGKPKGSCGDVDAAEAGRWT